MRKKSKSTRTEIWEKETEFHAPPKPCVTSDFIIQGDDELDGSKKSTSVELTTDVTLERPTNVICNKKLVVKSGNEVEFSLSLENSRSADHRKTRRGLAVLCQHHSFKIEGIKLSSRVASDADLKMMNESWSEFGCDVLLYSDKGNEFYKNGIVYEINQALQKNPNVEFFVFVLSTHGEEKDDRKVHDPEKKDVKFQHYFFSNDGQVKSQDFMDMIEGIEGLKGKVKLFFIQACRSRACHTEHETVDTGINIMVFDCEDANVLKRQTKYSPLSGITQSDAVGYIPDEESDDFQNMHKDANDVVSGKSVIIDSASNQVNVIEFLPTTWILHCNESVVMFASMSGKKAFSNIHSFIDEGGWLIKALNDALKEQKSGEKISILDLLTYVNQKVASRDSYKLTIAEGDGVLKAQSCIFYNITEELYLERN